MSIDINTSMDRITVNGVVYDVERESIPMGERLTITLDGEDVFPGIVGKLESEEYIETWMNPRADCPNVGAMSISYRGYNLGGGEHDEDISDIEFEIDVHKCEGSGEDRCNWVVGIHRTADPLVVGSQEECEEWLEQQDDKLDGRYYIEPIGCKHCQGDGVVTVNPVDYFKQERGARVVLPLIVYEHSGITMQVGHVGQVMGDAAGWDTSFVGFIFDTPETLKQTVGTDVTDEKIEEWLRGEVKAYASYLEGDVRLYDVDDEETNYMDSCGGFLGHDSGVEEECFCSLGNAIEKRLMENAERAHWAARDTVTI